MPAIKNNRIKQQIDRFKKSFLQSKELGIEVFFLPTALPTLSPIHRIRDIVNAKIPGQPHINFILKKSHFP